MGSKAAGLERKVGFVVLYLNTCLVKSYSLEIVGFQWFSSWRFSNGQKNHRQIQSSSNRFALWRPFSNRFFWVMNTANASRNKSRGKKTCSEPVVTCLPAYVALRCPFHLLPMRALRCKVLDQGRIKIWIKFKIKTLTANKLTWWVIFTVLWKVLGM